MRSIRRSLVSWLVLSLLREASLVASTRMGSIVETLLRLAEVEAGAIAPRAERIRVDEVVRDAWSSLATPAGERGLELAAQGTAEVVTDRTLFGIVVSNLLANAVHHAPEGSSLRSEIGTGARATVWRLANPAPDLTSDDLDLLDEPFWRKDPARGGEARAGLGLELVRTVARCLDIEIRFALEDDQLVVAVEIPESGTARVA